MRSGIDKARFIAVNGDASAFDTFGGFTYHLIRAASQQGLPYQGLDLSDQRFATFRKFRWTAKQTLIGNGFGGYQYSEFALENRWSKDRQHITDAIILSVFQMLPASINGLVGVRRWFYIDATLKQLFDVFGDCKNAGRSYIEDVLSREREGYIAAEGVVCHSTWAAKSVIEDYGLNPRKVHVVVPGANVDELALQTWKRSTRSRDKATRPDAPLRLVFVGRDWRRKGLDRLLRATRLAIESGAKIEVKVVGCDEQALPPEFQGLAWVRWIGLINKANPDIFFDTISSADFGCLLSEKECGGISLREFTALGLGMIAPNVGGSPDHCPPGAAVLVGPEETDAKLAETLCLLSVDRATIERMKKAAEAHAPEAVWSSSIRKIEQIIADHLPEGAAQTPM